MTQYTVSTSNRSITTNTTGLTKSIQTLLNEPNVHKVVVSIVQETAQDDHNDRLNYLDMFENDVEEFNDDPDQYKNEMIDMC